MLIICTGKIANTTVGHVDHALSYALGLKQLGHDVYLMEHVGPSRCIDARGQKIAFENWDGRAHFEQIGKRYGIWPKCCLIYKQGDVTYGMSFADALKVAKNCDLLITRSGLISKVPEIFEQARCRIYIDGNPGNTQYNFHKAGNDFDPLGNYEHLFTMGLNIGTEACSIPTDGMRWNPIMRPVVLTNWPLSIRLESERFTTISSWQGRSTFHWDGKHSGEKSDNWLQFLGLPEATGGRFEIALKIDAHKDQAVCARFKEKGWQLTDPGELRELNDYRSYVQGSRAEFSIAHNRYVEFVTGWFSDRSALYLASGKPVVVQSTGIESHLPTGKGLLTFTTLDEAVAAIEEINRNYPAHCRAARVIAEEYFDSIKVLRNMLNLIGAG